MNTANSYFASPSIRITPEMEGFFVAILLDHGTPAIPELYGFERTKLAAEIGKLMDGHPACPPITLKIKKSIDELGGRKPHNVTRDSDEWVFFTLKLADAYLDWLYAMGRLRAAQNL